jgi:hypothetical protein
MAGAALATAIATSVMTGLQMLELYWLERVAIRWRDVRLPHLGLALGLVPLFSLWDPAKLPPLARAAVTVAACGLYAAVLFLPARFATQDGARSVAS